MISMESSLFSFTSERTLREVVAGCSIEYLHGSEIASGSDAHDVSLAFRAQDVGLVVRAKKMSVLAQPGELTPEQIRLAASEWWEYWREYWTRREGLNPMPFDYACEVTVPNE